MRHDAHDAAVPDRTVRQFAALLGIFLGAFSARAWLQGAVPKASWLALLAAVVVVAGLLRPGTIRPVFTGAMLITTPIRLVVSGLLLRVLYYGVFTPMAVCFRLIGRDALARRRPDAMTYWTPKTMPTDPKSYFRQS